MLSPQALAEKQQRSQRMITNGIIGMVLIVMAAVITGVLTVGLEHWIVRAVWAACGLAVLASGGTLTVGLLGRKLYRQVSWNWTFRVARMPSFG